MADSKGVPAHFVALDPALAQRAVEGYKDELAPEHIKLEALYRQHKDCPRGCGTTMEKHAAHPNFAYGDPSWLLPRALMKCVHCGCVMNPFDGMVVELGKPDEANAGGHLLMAER